MNRVGDAPGPFSTFFLHYIAQATAALNPTPSGGGTLTCRQIVEQCDSTCQDPLCVRRCGDQGTPEAAQQHTALVDCTQRSGCMDLECIRASCPGESSTCEGPDLVQRNAKGVELTRRSMGCTRITCEDDDLVRRESGGRELNRWPSADSCFRKPTRPR